MPSRSNGDGGKEHAANGEAGHAGASRRRGVRNWQPATVDTEPLEGEQQAHAQQRRLRAEEAESGEELSVWDLRGNLLLLVTLYMIQGVPMGLALGAMPFMLQSRLSYAQVGTFSLAAYPYSFKLLWSPVVDALYWRRYGRRKSWIVPIQLLTAVLLYGCADFVNGLYEAADVTRLTVIFFAFVFLAATQDIAVDGWALTLLPPAHVGWAATCQTIGTSTGFFTSFTVFLALQDVKFCNAYVRSWGVAQRWLGLAPTSDVPLVSLPGYLRFWGVVFALVTLFIALLKPEAETWHPAPGPDADAGAPPQRDAETNGAHDGAAVHPAPPPQRGGVLSEVRGAYAALWGVVRLRAVWGLVALLLTYRVGVLVSEGASGLKLLDKGVPKETLAALVLLQFPVELASALLAGRWAASHSPAAPFLVSYFMRLAVNAATVALVAAFPVRPDSLAWGSPAGRLFAALAAVSLLTSAVSTVAFTSLGSLFNTISDPQMGGAYLTLLNTIANMGVILPKAPAFWLIDALTQVSCLPPAGAPEQQAARLAGLACPSKPSELGSPASQCAAAGGACALLTDGFYTVSWASLAAGLLLGLLYLHHVPHLVRLPLSAWRAAPSSPPSANDLRGRAKEA